jgi:hypothetical protein
VIENGTNGNGEGTRRRVGAVVLAVIFVGALGVAWLWARSSASETEARCLREAEKLVKAKTYIKANYERLLGSRDRREIPSPLRKTPLLSIVKNVSAGCGLADRIARVIEEENQKRNELTAKVTFRRIRIADIVNFLTVAKREYPGLYDREGRIRYARGQEADSWEVTLSLTAQKP